MTERDNAVDVERWLDGPTYAHESGLGVPQGIGDTTGFSSGEICR